MHTTLGEIAGTLIIAGFIASFWWDDAWILSVMGAVVLVCGGIVGDD